MNSEIDFVFPCPVEGCKNNNRCYRWTHHNCGGYEKITNEGVIYCVKCGSTDGLLTDWKFNCGEHDFIYPSAQELMRALYVMAQLNTDNQLFINKLMRKVAEHFGKKI